MTQTEPADQVPSRMTPAVVRRWPTALGLAGAAVGITVMVALDADVEFASGLAVMALAYVAAIAADRPSAAWVGLAAGLVVLVALNVFDMGADPVVAVLAVLLAVWMWGLHRLQALDGRWFRIETVGMLVFGLLAFGGMVAEPTLAGYLIGAGIVGHGLWDAWHFAIDKVVPRAYSEFCFVVDILVGSAFIAWMALS